MQRFIYRFTCASCASIILGATCLLGATIAVAH